MQSYDNPDPYRADEQRVKGGISVAEGVAGGLGVYATLGEATTAGFALEGAGAMALGGPVGIAVAVAGVVLIGAEMALDAYKDSRKFMSNESIEFLQRSGIHHDQAKALIDHSEDGKSPMPVLLEYARQKGVDVNTQAGRAKFVAWVNDQDSGKLSGLALRLHETAEYIKPGDISKDTTVEEPKELIGQADGGSQRERVYPSTIGQIEWSLNDCGLKPIS